MMISPGGYYEIFLKGRSAEEIARKIRGLKNTIGHLKKTIENPDCGIKPVFYPDEHTQLFCSRLYLERAIAAYEEAGGTYQPSKAEQRTAAFDAAIPTITKIVFSIGESLGRCETRTIALAEDHFQLYVEHSLFPDSKDIDIEPDYPMPKEEFLDELRYFHIGEWRRHYDASNYGVYILDGIQWELTIEFADGRKAKYDGRNAYPFSFDRFCELIGYEEKMEN